MRVEYVRFRDRGERAAYLVQRFGELLNGRVLDVGCDQAYLRQMLPGRSYVGVDRVGAPDLCLDLERLTYLPFQDATFDGVVCLDVLEHLDNLHAVFGELVRVSKRHVILALPNNWANARQPLGRGRGSFNKYGLPPEPPRDRHKWFFSLSEALDFVRYQAEKHAVRLGHHHATEKPRPLWVRLLRRLVYPTQACYLNRYAHTLWVVLDKQRG